jgi:hypothetical protein
VQLGGGAQALKPGQDTGLERTIVGRPALEGLGILARDHQHARAGSQDRRQLGGMQEPLDRAVEHEVGGAQRRDRRRVALQGDARARRADRDRTRVRRRRHTHVDDTTAEVLGSQPSDVHESGTTRRLAQHRDDLAGSQTARDERAAEHIERAVLHQTASTMSR